MLTALFIRDFAIVQNLELTFDDGFTILTGETGAGKSIIIDALSLLLGSRGETRYIRHGCKKAEISATFSLRGHKLAGNWLQQQDLEDAGECILRRIIFVDKPTRAFINGRPVPVQNLRQLGELLVDIHGQHEHQSLLKRECQRQILDDYAGHMDLVEKIGQTYRHLLGKRQALQNIESDYAGRLARVDLLRFQIEELEESEPRTGEYTNLQNEQTRLAHATELIQGIQSGLYSIFDDEENSIDSMLGQNVRALSELQRFDDSLEDSLHLLREASVQLQEAASSLRHHLDRLEQDPERLQTVQHRLSRLIDLGRKHAVSPDDLYQVLEKLKSELEGIENLDEDQVSLRAELDELQIAFEADCRLLHKKRQKTAARLSGLVSAEMQQLGMDEGKFSVDVKLEDTPRWTGHGADLVEFMVSANPGQPARPLARVASGGELSRISLALQVVVAAIGSVPTLIFDEVDVGIGGGVAEVVGRKLRSLGRQRQVFCITHLPQVAARGEQQLQVKKQNEDDILVNVRALQHEERVDEIARMLGGMEITQQTRAHAQEMLEKAS